MQCSANIIWLDLFEGIVYHNVLLEMSSYTITSGYSDDICACPGTVCHGAVIGITSSDYLRFVEHHPVVNVIHSPEAGA